MEGRKSVSDFLAENSMSGFTVPETNWKLTYRIQKNGVYYRKNYVEVMLAGLLFSVYVGVVSFSALFVPLLLCFAYIQLRTHTPDTILVIDSIAISVFEAKRITILLGLLCILLHRNLSWAALNAIALCLAHAATRRTKHQSLKSFTKQVKELVKME